LEQNVGLAYFYFDYKDEEQQTPINVVGTIVKQLVCTLHVLPSEVERAYTDSIRCGLHPDFDSLICLLTALVTRFGSFYAIFDAFDECHDNNREQMWCLIQRLRELSAKVMLTSRHHPETLQSLEGTLPIRASDADIGWYLRSRLAKERNVSPGIRDKAIEILKSGADGMYTIRLIHLTSCRFRLAEFQLNYVLRTRSLRKIDESLKSYCIFVRHRTL
jgi:hypothetical protein